MKELFVVASIRSNVGCTCGHKWEVDHLLSYGQNLQCPGCKESGKIIDVRNEEGQSIQGNAWMRNI